MPKSDQDTRKNKNRKLRKADLTPKQLEKYTALAKKAPKGMGAVTLANLDIQAKNAPKWVGALTLARFEYAKGFVSKLSEQVSPYGIKLDLIDIPDIKSKKHIQEITKKYQEMGRTQQVPVHRNLKLFPEEIKRFIELEKTRVKEVTEQREKTLQKQWYEKGQPADMTVAEYKKQEISGFDEYFARETRFDEILNREDFEKHTKRREEQAVIGYVEYMNMLAQVNYIKAMNTTGLLDTPEGRELADYISNLSPEAFAEIFTTEKYASIKGFIYPEAGTEDGRKERIRILREVVWKMDLISNQTRGSRKTTKWSRDRVRK
jgi:hypothetical protein